MISRDNAKQLFNNLEDGFTLNDVHQIFDNIYDGFEILLKKEVQNNTSSEDAKSCIIDEQRKQLLELKAENELLKRCVEEAIKKPMGVEPHIYSDWKMKQK